MVVMLHNFVLHEIFLTLPSALEWFVDDEVPHDDPIAEEARNTNDFLNDGADDAKELHDVHLVLENINADL